MAKLRKRFKTLLVPYLIWSVIAIGSTYLLEIFPYTCRFVLGTKITDIDNLSLLVHDFHCAAYPILQCFMAYKIVKNIYFSILMLLWIG